MKTASYILALGLLSMTAFDCSCHQENSDPIVTTNYKIKEDGFVVYSGLITQSPKEYLEMEQVKMVRSFADQKEKLYDHLPSQVDLSSELPSPGDQGNQNSCAAWTVAYAVKSFQENRELGWGLNQDHLFSPSFIYNQINGGEDKGADLVDAMNFMMQSGSVPLNLMPYDKNDYLSKPDTQLKELALGFRALGFRRTNETNLDEIKSFLATGEPVIVVLEMYDNFLKKGMQSSHAIYKEKSGNLLGYHAVVIVGYDDQKQAVKILNSWGSQWGEAGYGWISYSFFPSIIKRAYMIYDTPTLSPTLLAVTSFANQIQSSSEDFLVGIANQMDETIIVTPNEAGIKFKDTWQRLGDPLSQGLKKIKPALFPDFLFKDKIGRFHFTPQQKIPVYTNRGITFGSTREDVNRIYQTPDYVDPRFNTDTYFLHAITDKWAGSKFTRHASLTFTYNANNEVTGITLANVFKESFTGEHLRQFEDKEKIVQSDGSYEINSLVGNIRFVVPSQFSEMQKGDWKEGGMGYFFKNPSNIYEFLAVKIILLDTPFDQKLLEERIKLDLESHNSEHFKLSTKSFAGKDWTMATDAIQNARYYYFQDSTLYQIEMMTDADILQKDWAIKFLESVELK